MRYFNTSGPCYPEKHYTILRKDLISQGMQSVHRGKFITIFAPRQAGKTTFYYQLSEALREEGRLTPIWISFENLKKMGKKRFYEALTFIFGNALESLGISSVYSIKDELDLLKFFKALRSHYEHVVLIIDEFEAL